MPNHTSSKSLQRITLQQCIKESTQQLATTINQPRLEAELLLAHVLGKERTFLYTHPDYQLAEAEHHTLLNLIDRRLRGEPIAYILGHKEFWSLDFLVSPATLIPRPETELLVEVTLQKLPKEQALFVADLGTGSGAIALALAHERPRWKIVASDQSCAAIEIAKKNAEKMKVTHVEFCTGDWCTALQNHLFDAIVSNPPYIAENDLHLLEGDLRFEPHAALISGKDGLDALRTIIHQSRDHLKTGGFLILEHGFNQSTQVKALLLNAHYQQITPYSDLANHPRVIAACKG